MDRIKVTLGQNSQLLLDVIEEPQEPAIDLSEHAEMLIRLGLPGTPLRARDGDGVEFAQLTATGPVRFTVNGQRISTEAGLELIATGLRQVICDHVGNLLHEQNDTDTRCPRQESNLPMPD